MFLPHLSRIDATSPPPHFNIADSLGDSEGETLVLQGGGRFEVEFMIPGVRRISRVAMEQWRSRYHAHC